jgi:hypothetical protein
MTVTVMTITGRQILTGVTIDKEIIMNVTRDSRRTVITSTIREITLINMEMIATVEKIHLME